MKLTVAQRGKKIRRRRQAPRCPQCGRTLRARACGQTHALLAAARRRPKYTEAQLLLCEQLKPVAAARGLRIEPEYAAIPGRSFRVDVALLEAVPMAWVGYAIEIDGGIWIGGRHSGGTGQVKDMEKLNLLVEPGWKPLKFTPKQVETGEALAQIRRCL